MQNTRYAILGLISLLVVILVSGGLFITEQSQNKNTLVTTYDQNIRLLNEQISLLEERLSKVMEPSGTNSDDSYKSGNYRELEWGNVIGSRSFSRQGKTGFVHQVCGWGYYVSENDVCLGKGAYVLEWNNELLIIEEFDTDTFEKAFVLEAVGFNEGNFTHATSTNSSQSLLHILTNDRRCTPPDGMCWDYTYITHVIDVSSSAIIKIPLKPDFETTVANYGFDDMTWNASGTKAIITTLNCGEGCPNGMLHGFDVTTGRTQVLLSESDLNESPERYDMAMEFRKALQDAGIVWKDNSTVVLPNGKELAF